MRQYAIAIALAALAAAHAPARTVRVTVEGAAAQAARGAPLVIEEWGVITNADGSVTRHPYAKSVVAAARNEMETTCAVTSGVVRIGLVSAVTGTVAAAILGPGRSWCNQAADSSGVLALSGGYALPRATSRPVGTVDYGLGALDVDARRWALYGGADVAATNRGAVRVRVAWTSPGFADEAYAELPLDEAPAGTSLVAVTADLDGNGAYTPGEPYGVAVSTNGLFDGGVMLTWTSPSILRIDLAQAVGANTFDAQKGLCDRGIRVWGTGADVDAGSIDTLRPGTDMPPSTVTRLPLRLVRVALNGITSNHVSSTTTYYARRGVQSWIGSLLDNPCMNEAALLARGVLDIDQGLSNATYVAGSLANVTSATYCVMTDHTPVSPIADNLQGLLATAFVNRFEGVRMNCTPTSPVSTNQAIGSPPTLVWRHDNSIGKNYPAFRLRIWNHQTQANANNLCYDTGVRQAPARSVTGEYSWRAPIHLGDGKFFAGSNYWWSVSMLDAKFPSAGTAEPRGRFRMPKRILCDPVSPVTNEVVTVVPPTLVWRHDDPLGMSFPEFRLRIWDNESLTNETALCYDSGIQPVPARSVTGEYSWTPQIQLGDGKFFAGSNYWWSVSMLNDLFPSPDYPETRAAFRMPKRILCDPVSPVTNEVVTVVPPTLVWRHDDPLGMSFPEFRLRIWDNESLTNETALCYDSGIQPVPARSVTGEYSWTPQIQLGDGKFFAGSNYWWSVSMLNDLFPSPDDTETRAAFRMPAQEGAEQ